jgi:hypothetical protein
MRHIRKFGFALWLALALVAGQQLALLHDLGHAAEKVAQKQDSKPASKCDQHFASAQFVGAATVPYTPPRVDCAAVAIAFHESPAGARQAPAYRAQAPPVVL